ncbi:hypothetical protein [Neomoorella thermoacetica]|uniref:hypothetical protein n=1 Tax=Neomoorella thermoacetica TaxID=1525 RepID=UPI0008FA744A|nr:hypothetical protein [Moorella thermoacetica]OIQ10365.1 hypothetical protein MOOTH_27370 [Moorella thermoacetica]
MNQMPGCLALLLFLIPFIILAVIGVPGDIVVILFFAALVGLAIWGIIDERKQKQEVKKTEERILGDESRLGEATVELIGGNHPLLGSSQRAVKLVVTKSNLVITDVSNGVGRKIPLIQVKAQVATQSALSAMGIFLFGLLAFGAKDKLLVIEFDDPASKESYNSVFKGINNPEMIADLINRQRYFLLTGSKS